MYQNIKTCIRKGEECSVFFNSEVGVKQGENISPFLFSLLNTTIFVLFVFTVSFQMLQYSSKADIAS
jgi:hypothetical protein